MTVHGPLPRSTSSDAPYVLRKTKKRPGETGAFECLRSELEGHHEPFGVDLGVVALGVPFVDDIVELA